MILKLLLMLCHSCIQYDFFLARKHLLNINFHPSQKKWAQYSMQLCYYLQLTKSTSPPMLDRTNKITMPVIQVEKQSKMHTWDFLFSSNSSFIASLLHLPEKSNLKIQLSNATKLGHGSVNSQAGEVFNWRILHMNKLS